MHADIKTHTK